MIVVILVLLFLCLSGLGGYYWYAQNPEDPTDKVEEPPADDIVVVAEEQEDEVVAALAVKEEEAKTLCVGAWESIGACTKSCGGGKQSQQWKVTTPGENCAVPEGQRQRQIDCNSQACPVPCVGAWESIGACTKSCGGGKLNQQWKVTTPGENCAVPEGQRQRQIDCNSQACPVPCVGAWENVGVCSKRCEGGKQSQQWKVTTPGENCAVPEGQRQRQIDCNTQGCTVGDLLVEKGWRTAEQVLRMSASDQRNTMIVELKNATNTPVYRLQAKNNAALIAMAKPL